MNEVPDSELAALFPGGEPLLRAGLGALEKGDYTFRVIHDGTHGVGYNSRIKVRGQLKRPGPAEVNVVMAHSQKEGGFCFLSQRRGTGSTTASNRTTGLLIRGSAAAGPRKHRSPPQAGECARER